MDHPNFDTDFRKDVYHTAVEMMNDAGLDAALMEDYSGRAMYGEVTPAIVTTEPATVVGYFVTRAAVVPLMGTVALDKEMLDQVRLLLPKRSDDMAMSRVYY